MTTNNINVALKSVKARANRKNKQAQKQKIKELDKKISESRKEYWKLQVNDFIDWCFE